MNTLQAITEFVKKGEELRQFKEKMDEYSIHVEYYDNEDVITLNYSSIQGFCFEDDEMGLSVSKELSDHGGIYFFNIYEKPTPEDFRTEMIKYFLEVLNCSLYPPFSLSLLKDMLSIAKELESQELTQAVHKYIEKQ